jgi:uncharacterized protein (DUF983 family)
MTWQTSLFRGIQRRCPQCKHKDIFEGLLKVRDHCPSCHTPLGLLPCDDAPPYIVIFLLGHIMIPFILFLDHHYEISFTSILIISCLCLIGGTLALLPFVKGGVLGILWYLKTHKSLK